VCFLCHCPSGCPDRELPGALPCGVRTFLPAFALPKRLHATAGYGAAVAWLAAIASNCRIPTTLSAICPLVGFVTKRADDVSHGSHGRHSYRPPSIVRGSSLTTSAESRHTASVQAAEAGSHEPKSRRRRPWHDRPHALDVHAPRSIRAPHHDGVAHQTSLRSRWTMMTRANSLHMREAGSLISLPVTHDHDPHKHPRTGATVMTAVVGCGGRTRRN
jgi:hypothetical protein